MKTCDNCGLYSIDRGIWCMNGWSKDGSNGFCHLTPKQFPVAGNNFCGQWRPK